MILMHKSAQRNGVLQLNKVTSLFLRRARARAQKLENGKFSREPEIKCHMRMCRMALEWSRDGQSWRKCILGRDGVPRRRRFKELGQVGG